MVSIFLKAEVGSSRFSPALINVLQLRNKGRKIIELPDLKNADENRRRAEILGAYRGYGQNNYLYVNFPNDVKWRRILLDQGALERIRYADCSPWRELSGGTLLIADAAKRIRDGIAENQNTKDIVGLIRATADYLKNGGPVPEVIIVSQSENAQRVAIEGHNRLSAYLVNGVTTPISAILGVSPNLTQWLAQRWQ